MIGILDMIGCQALYINFDSTDKAKSAKHTIPRFAKSKTVAFVIGHICNSVMSDSCSLIERIAKIMPMGTM